MQGKKGLLLPRRIAIAFLTAARPHLADFEEALRVCFSPKAILLIGVSLVLRRQTARSLSSLCMFLLALGVQHMVRSYCLILGGKAG